MQGSGKVAVDFNDVQIFGALEQRPCERAASGADLYDALAARRRNGVDDSADDARIVQEVLAEALTNRHSLRPSAQPRFDIGSDGALKALVSAAFSHRRKTLRNGLKGLLTGEDIESCGIDPQRRPETLSPAQFGLLAARYCRLRAAAAGQRA